MLLLIINQLGFSQTKLIAHKSHSGSDETFAIASENNLFENDNLGLGRMEIQEVTNLDSIVYLSNDKVLAYTSNYTQRYRFVKPDKCIKPELTKIKADTLTIKPKIFKKGLTIFDVKAIVDTLKSYNNDLSQVKYKGFDEKSKRKINRKKKSFLPIMMNFPNVPNSYILVVILAVLSTLLFFILTSLQTRKMNFSS